MASGHSNAHGYVATDSMVKRDRMTRGVVLLISFILVLVIPTLVGVKIARDIIHIPMIGVFAGLALGVVGFSKIIDLFFVGVDTAAAFITVNQVAAFFGSKDVYVSYGPGFHISFPWERREKDNNISLEEASEDFSMTVQGTTGEINIKGSTRLRPDIEHIATFRGGAGSVADNLVDIIKSFILEHIAGMSLEEALHETKKINAMLNERFVGSSDTSHHGHTDAKQKHPQVTDFETRFGVKVSDVTVAEILPSADARKTRNAVDEAEQLAKTTAKLLGYTTLAEAKAAGLTEADVARARNDAMATSGNETKVDVKRQDFAFTMDAKPEVVDALKALAPALALLMAGKTDTKGK